MRRLWQLGNASQQSIHIHIAACNNFNIHLQHLVGKKTVIADALSHNQINRFFSLAPQAKRIPLPFQTDSSSFKPATSTPTTTGPILYMSSSTYRSGCKQFKNFCCSIQVRPVQASKSTITMFTAYLSRRVSPSMDRVYLAAVSLLHCQAGLSSPSHHNPQTTATTTEDGQVPFRAHHPHQEAYHN